MSSRPDEPSNGGSANGGSARSGSARGGSAPGKAAPGKAAPGKAAPGKAAPGKAQPGADRAHRTRRDGTTGITVAVTGPTGAIGRSVIRALESDDRVDRILGMARRPFDPAALGWRKTQYRQGDVVDRAAVDKFVAGADVVVHLAYAMAPRDQSRKINVTGTRNVFEATVEADRPYRLVYTSSLAAYGYHADDPSPLTEDVPARGSPEHYYSAQKAECEAMLTKVTAGRGMQVYVLRPCVVVGADSTVLMSNLRLEQVTQFVPPLARDLLARVPGLKPVLPDPGTPIQLIHEDDVGAAVRAAALGDGPPGVYNLAAEGEITMSDLAHAAGAYAVPIPNVLVGVASRIVAALPWHPAELEWIHAARCPMLMDTTRARRDLDWKPQYTSRQALDTMVRAARG